MLQYLNYLHSNNKNDSMLFVNLVRMIFSLGERRPCLEAWHINMSNHALNRDDGAYLPEEYMHLIGR
jgi:hypothetical protein